MFHRRNRSCSQYSGCGQFAIVWKSSKQRAGAISFIAAGARVRVSSRCLFRSRLIQPAAWSAATISKVGSAWYILPICKIWTLHYSAYWFWGLHIQVILHIVAYICKTICTICKIICKKIVQGSYSAYSAYCNMQNRQNMSNNMLHYAKQYAKYAFCFVDNCPFVWCE